MLGEYVDVYIYGAGAVSPREKLGVEKAVFVSKGANAARFQDRVLCAGVRDAEIKLSS
jgi:hypothetical protein